MMSSDEGELRRGPWTVEEDVLLVNYIAAHGEGRWNALARCAGLRRTGKSCRLRWLNYLRPDLRRGNMTAQEQLLILELHSRWGNRWSKIAQHLPGRTDNEIKNYWRTRVQKHARQLNCDVNSRQFKDLMRYLWMPRLLERIADVELSSCCTTDVSSSSVSTDATQQQQQQQQIVSPPPPPPSAAYYSNSSNTAAAAAAMTWDDQPQQTTACSWSDESSQLLVPTAGSMYYGDMLDLPELGDTDDLWYTHIMGL
ncbi:hypothetical protein HU200_012673 [Digitaria exilis]|uniref:Uncharacterized protein n=1 Tax=Digitaria exilis TaxID=1010633 RepID=A0A835FEY8_9POAL|nr:hypothetical protein HU200_012673 [Digitaria exilis]